ncbi:hypothetical protein B0H17DRAFT_1205542 [Mycena rosella]|uniref:Uncharacterized protein n=1 Tax=Mycena rosella TaxID=1033263 RepID=A0AAD7D6P4_MYCRO|nr:hypothetical protein B0H17DRAFT_1205542 [Mycena rosella]
MAPGISKRDKMDKVSLLEPPEIIFPPEGDEAVKDDKMEVDNPGDDAVDYGDGDSGGEGSDASNGTLKASDPAGTSSESDDLEDDMQKLKGRAMCTYTKKRVMALEGEDKVRETKLRERIENQKWLLNENLMVPECKGLKFDPDDDEPDNQCDVCTMYMAHVADEYSQGKGSLKAVLQLRELYMLADERDNIAQLKEENRKLEIANHLADLLDTKAKEDLLDVQRDRSRLEQMVGRLQEQLSESNGRHKRLEERIEELKEDLDKVDSLNRNLRDKLDSTTDMRPRHENPADGYDGGAFYDGMGTTSRMTRRLLRKRPPDLRLPKCYVPPASSVLQTVDKRGFAVDAATWDEHWALARACKYWVLAHRCFMLYAFGLDVPESDRTPAQQKAVEEFFMTDWHADFLSRNARISDTSWAERNRLLALNGITWTMIPLACIADAAARDRLETLGLTPAPVFTPMRWDENTLSAATLDTVVTCFAHMGVSIAMIDDAFAFGVRWLMDWQARTAPPPVWAEGEVDDLIQASNGMADLAGYFSETEDMFPRPAGLHWMVSVDNIAAFQLSNYRHPELVGMRRQPNSVVQQRIDAGLKGEPPVNCGVIHKYNLFLPETKARIKAGKNRAVPRAMPPGATHHMHGVHPSVQATTTFTQTALFDPTLFAINTAHPSTSSVSYVSHPNVGPEFPMEM